MLGDHIFAPHAVDQALGVDSVTGHPERMALVTTQNPEGVS